MNERTPPSRSLISCTVRISFTFFIIGPCSPHHISISLRFCIGKFLCEFFGTSIAPASQSHEKKNCLLWCSETYRAPIADFHLVSSVSHSPLTDFPNISWLPKAKDLALLTLPGAVHMLAVEKMSGMCLRTLAELVSRSRVPSPGPRFRVVFLIICHAPKL